MSNYYWDQASSNQNVVAQPLSKVNDDASGRNAWFKTIVDLARNTTRETATAVMHDALFMGYSFLKGMETVEIQKKGANTEEAAEQLDYSKWQYQSGKQPNFEFGSDFFDAIDVSKSVSKPDDQNNAVFCLHIGDSPSVQYMHLHTFYKKDSATYSEFNWYFNKNVQNNCYGGDLRTGNNACLCATCAMKGENVDSVWPGMVDCSGAETPSEKLELLSGALVDMAAKGHSLKDEVSTQLGAEKPSEKGTAVRGAVAMAIVAVVNFFFLCL